MLTIRQYNLSSTHSHSNMVYNLSLTDLSEQARLSWYSPDDDVKMCLVKGKDEEACQNYIRILVSPAPGRLQICGTNSFRPMCRQYQVGEQNYTMVSEKNGQVVCPYDPRHNSTAVFVGTYSRFLLFARIRRARRSMWWWWWAKKNQQQQGAIYEGTGVLINYVDLMGGKVICQNVFPFRSFSNIFVLLLFFISR